MEGSQIFVGCTGGCSSPCYVSVSHSYPQRTKITVFRLFLPLIHLGYIYKILELIPKPKLMQVFNEYQYVHFLEILSLNRVK